MRRSATVSLFLLLSPPVALRIATLVLPTFCSDRDSESQAAHPRLPDRVLAARALRAPNAPNPAQHQEPNAPAGCSVGSGAATGRVPAPARPSSAGAPSVGASPRRRGRRYLVDRPLGPPRLRGKRPWHTVGDGAEGALQDLASLTRLTARIVGGRFDPAVPVNHSRGSGYGAAPTGSRATCPLPDALVEVRREVSAVHS